MTTTSPKLFLSASDQIELESWVRSRSIAHALAQRAQIILLLAQGDRPGLVAHRLGVSRPTVFKWRIRFQQQGLEGLEDLPRPGQPRKLTAKKIKQILTMTTQRVPKEATHWSLRLMARYAKTTVWQVHQIWTAAGLKPHRLQTFKISNDPEFAEKVVDVVGLYLNPPDNAMVLSVDEKTQIQAKDRTQPPLPLQPGQIERQTHDYRRHGITNLYAAFDILTGQVIGQLTQQHRAKEYLDFLDHIDRSTPRHLDLHLIADNSSTHKTPAVNAWLAAHPRVKVHFTPTSASWLNAVEGWFAKLERRALTRGRFNSVEDLKKTIQQFIKTYNKTSAKPFRWNKSAQGILDAVERAKLGATKAELIN
jgi:transposase